MSCFLEFANSHVSVEFCCQGSKQKILIDVLTKYSSMDMNKLALTLGVPMQTLKNISEGKSFLTGEEADNLGQLFLMFFAQQFLRNWTLVRNFNY